MRRFRLFLLFTLLASNLAAQRYSNGKYALSTEQSVRRDSVLQKLLITCEGTSGPRVFMETLSQKLIKDLEKKKITAAYAYTGVTDEESIQRTEEAKNEAGCDAILKFEQSDESGNPIKVSHDPMLSVIAGGVITVRTTTLKQTFLVTLTSADADKKLYWKAILKVNFDHTNASHYSELVKMVMLGLYDVNCFAEKPKK